MSEEEWQVVKSKKGSSTSNSAGKNEDSPNHGQRTARDTSHCHSGASQSKGRGHSSNNTSFSSSNRRVDSVLSAASTVASKVESGRRSDSNAKYSAIRTPGSSKAFSTTNQGSELSKVSKSINDGSKVYENKPSKYTTKISATSQVPDQKHQQRSTPGTQQKEDETKPSKKKKKKVSATERRRKREEKFFQALYKNKDSHIQFVSADFIRQFQNVNSGASSSKAVVNKSDSNLPSVIEDPPVSIAGVWQTRRQCVGLDRLDLHFPSLSQDGTAAKEPNLVGEVLESLSGVSSEGAGAVYDRNHDVEIKKTETNTGYESPIKFTPPPISNKKKSQRPMVLDIGTLAFTSKKEEVEEKKTPFSSSTKSGFVKENYKVTAGNPLDSSGPGVIHRGKIRQKKKKPSKLKMTILKSRAIKKLFATISKEQIAKKITTENTTEFNENHEIVYDNENTNIISIEETEEDKNNDNEKELRSSSSNPPVSLQRNTDTSIQTVLQTKEGPAVVITNDHTPMHKASCEVDKRVIQLFNQSLAGEIGDKSLELETEVAVKVAIHSRKFRDYCDMYTTKELHGIVIQLISELYRFQDRLYHTDPIKFKTKRRLVTGLKDAMSYLNLNKVQLLIIAPDIEKNAEPGGLDDRVCKILTLAKEKKVPYIFSGNKYILGKPIKIRTPVSIIAILDKQNCEELFRKLLDEADILREKYTTAFLQKAEELKLENQAKSS